MAIGAAVSAAAVWVTYLHTDAPVLAWLTAAFLFAGALRHLIMVRFDRANLAPDDADGAQSWEFCATVATVGTALLYGIWCFISLTMITHPFAALTSVMVSIAVLIGLTTRSFAIDRIVTLASASIAVPLAAGLFLVGNVYYAVIGVLLLPFLFSIRKLAGNVRDILLAAIHGRQDASRLAGELDDALTTMAHGLCMLDEKGRVAVVNRQSQCGFLGESPERYIGWHFSEVLADVRNIGLLPDVTADHIEAKVASGEHSKLVIEFENSRQCEITINTRLGHTVLLMEDITARVLAAERITFMARYDGLTQLSNRFFFSDQVHARLKEGQALNDTTKVMMMIVDLDDFKHVNDTFGHPIGDALLVEMADRIRSIFGDDVLVARFGGDEFMVFRPHNANEQEAIEDAQAILAVLRIPFNVQEDALTVNASIGITLANVAEVELDILLTQADLALYEAKGDGKGRFCLFKEEMNIAYRQRQRLKADLLEAADNNELYLLFQPIVTYFERKVVGCEALLRWRHPELGLIPPMEFIPIAEEIGAMPAISRWVVETAARECAKWPKEISVSVNLSATDFRDSDVVELVSNGLKKSGLAPERLIVEITETAIIDDLDGAIKALNAIRSHGVGVALDDFGTGYSSLCYLHSLPFTRLKIDRSFVVNVTSDDRARHLLSNIARLSRDLDLTVTVEGIETEEQWQVIAETAQVDFAQGYLFGAPLTISGMTELISRWTPNRAGDAVGVPARINREAAS